MTAENNKIKILFVEDDPNLSMVLKDYLEMVGYEVFHAKDGEQGLLFFASRGYDLLILDVMMPKKDGFTLAHEIRQKNQIVPIIFLTAKILKEDRIKGFTYGCDDYITKPFSTEELSLRIQAILKRCAMAKMSKMKPSNDIFEIGNFKFDSQNQTLNGEGVERRLTRKESALLKMLCLSENNLLPRELALETIWGNNDYFISRSMDVFIAKLRKYLASDPRVNIINVHGLGFKLLVSSK